MGPSYCFRSGIHDPENIVSIPIEARLEVLDSRAEVQSTLCGRRGEWAAVSVCCSDRVPSRAHEAGVETLKEYWDRGYGTAAMAGWAIAVRELGCIALYSTSWDGGASQRVAAKLGLVL